MDDSGPSGTALATAYARAYHQMVDRPLILTDPYAARVLGVSSDELAAMIESPADASVAGAVQRPRRLFFAARARFAEERVAAAHRAGVRQVVVLGAGMDTFGLRNAQPGLRVFEVDHPATQAWKRRRLAESGLDIPAATTFVPVDFETDLLATELESVGMSRSEPAVFVWLGVVYYLTASAIDVTLNYVAGQADGSEIVFDYLRPASGVEDGVRLRERADRLAAAGEPWFSWFRPPEVATMMRDRGFVDLEDLGADELVDRYSDGSTSFTANTPDALRASRIVSAAHTR